MSRSSQIVVKPPSNPEREKRKSPKPLEVWDFFWNKWLKLLFFKKPCDAKLLEILSEGIEYVLVTDE